MSSHKRKANTPDRKEPTKSGKISCMLNATEQLYDANYQSIINCLTTPNKYNFTKNAVLNFLYKRGENNGFLIDRRKTLELCTNKKLLNMFVIDKRNFNFETDNVCCSICGIRITPNDKVEIDHLIPSTLFFCLFARYYHSGCQNTQILKDIHGRQACNEYYQMINECGNFVTRLISVTHRGCNQSKGDDMFFIIHVNGDPKDPAATWSLTPNVPVIDAFINRYIDKLYPVGGLYTGVGYMNADDFRNHALTLTSGNDKDSMYARMKTRLTSFVETVSSQYNGGIMGNIFDNLHLLRTIPLKLISKEFKVSIDNYIYEIDEKYGSGLSNENPPRLENLNGIVEIETTSTQKTDMSRIRSTVPRKSNIYSNQKSSILYNFFIRIDVPNPSFEQVCETIDSAIEKKNVEQQVAETGLGFVRKKTKKNKKIIRRRPTKANKTRNKRT